MLIDLSRYFVGENMDTTISRAAMLAVRTHIRAGRDPAQCQWGDQKCRAMTLDGYPLEKDGKLVFE